MTSAIRSLDKYDIIVERIQKQLEAHSTKEAKAAHQKFVPGEDKIYGVRTPVLNKLAAAHRDGGFDLINALWAAGALEEKLLAVKILERTAKKDPKQTLKLVKKFAKNIGNWAVCDAIGMQGTAQLKKSHEDEIFALAKKFNSSPDLWQRRLSLVLVEWYTRFPALHPAIRQLVKPLENDKEYYVKKAVVWIKKNFDKGK